MSAAAETVRISLLQLQEEIDGLLAWLKPQEPKIILEIGAHQGGMAIGWCQLATEMVLSVDLPGGNGGGLSFEQCLERDAMLRNHFPHYTGILGDSHDKKTQQVVADLLGEKKADFLFIDGDHSYHGVKRDFNEYSRFVKAGGWVGFHDINDTEIHHKYGCHVAPFWNELHGEKLEFNMHAPWGGIGVIRV